MIVSLLPGDSMNSIQASFFFLLEVKIEDVQAQVGQAFGQPGVVEGVPATRKVGPDCPYNPFCDKPLCWFGPHLEGIGLSSHLNKM